MSEARKMPSVEVMMALHRKKVEVADKTASIKEEYTERVAAQRANGNFRPAIEKTFNAVMDKALKSEIAAIDMAHEVGNE